ncbi:MAG TPA: hypothetical protein VL919_17050 [Vicinamibacterales bacterium]|jgi:hypothetical protein|nr:hypothetical protein [Vicinamibacterales bacterium]
MMDFVEEVLKFLTARMQIEAEWAVQERTSFTWWAHTLAQRVWVAEPREFQGVQLTTLHIETDVLADVPMDAATWTRLAAVNQYATLSAYVADTAQGTIRLHASVSLTADNFLLAQSIALHAMALQMADAYAEAAELAAAFGGTVAATPHPHRGLRAQPDEMVGILEVYQQRGNGDSPFDADEIAQLVHLDPRPWTMAANQEHRLDADLEFATDVHARLEVDASERHPSLGSGLQMRLLLPVEPDDAIAQKLNASECLEPDAHQLGAWCVDREHGLMFTGFVPAAAYGPGLARALIYHLSAKNDWARALLFPSA